MLLHTAVVITEQRGHKTLMLNNKLIQWL